MLSAMSWGPFYSNPQIFSKPLWLADNLCLCLSHLWILCLENYFPHYPSAAHLSGPFVPQAGPLPES